MSVLGISMELAQWSVDSQEPPPSFWESVFMGRFHFSSKTHNTFVDTRHWANTRLQRVYKECGEEALHPACCTEACTVLLNGLVWVLKGWTSRSSLIWGKTEDSGRVNSQPTRTL